MVCSLKEKKQNKSICVSIVSVQYPNAHKGMSLDIAIISSYAMYFIWMPWKIMQEWSSQY